MTRELIEYFMDEDNWRLNESQLDQLNKTLDDFVFDEISFTERNVIDNIEDNAFITEIGFDDVKNELFVRNILNGKIEEDYFMK